MITLIETPAAPGTMKRLEQLEAFIEKNQQTFIEVGLALAEIRETKLWRADYTSFQEYCAKKWGWAKSYTNNVIRAAQAVRQLPQEAATIVATESQAREIAKLPPEKRTNVINLADARAKQEGRKMTAKDIREAAQGEPDEKPRIRSADEVLAVSQEDQLTQLRPLDGKLCDALGIKLADAPIVQAELSPLFQEFLLLWGRMNAEDRQLVRDHATRELDSTRP